MEPRFTLNAPLTNIVQSLNITESLSSNSSFTMPLLEMSRISQFVLYSLYCTTILASVLGNSVVIFVLVKGRRSKKRLNAFLINLAVADLLMACFCMPYTFTETMLGRWVFGPVMCPLVSFVQVVSVAISIFTNMAISIDRYRAVTAPISENVAKIGSHIAIASLWVGAVFLALPLLVTVRSYNFPYGEHMYHFCDEQWSDTQRMSYTLAILCVTYIIPLCVISGTYIRILAILRRHTTPGNSDNHRDSKILKSKQRVIKMLMVIVILFAFLWLPIHVFSLIKDFFPSILFDTIRSRRDELRMYVVFYSCHWLAMANSLVNPVIYSFMNDCFKADVRFLIRPQKLCGCFRSGRRGSCRSSAYIPTANTKGTRRNVQHNVP